MNLMKFLFVILLLMLLVGCAAEAQSETTVEPQPTPSWAVTTPTPSKSPRPTRVETPTVNYQVKIDEAAYQLQLALGSATIGAVTQRAIDTAQAKLDTAGQKTSAALTFAAQTKDAHAVETADRGATGTVQAPLNEREWIRTSWETTLQATICSGVVLVFVALICAIFAVTQAKSTSLLAQAPKAEPAQQPVQEPVKVKLDMRDEYGWGSVDWTTLPIDRPTLRKVADLIVVHGARYNQVQMTGAGKPLIKDNTFDSFGSWMRVNKIAIRLDDGRYVIQHRTFFEQVLNE